MARITLLTGTAGGLGQSVAAKLAAFIGALRDAKCPGSGVLVSSAAARIGTPNHETVAAAKAGVEGLVRSAAATYAGNGIRINAVAPRHHGHAGRGGHSGQRDGPRGGGSPGTPCRALARRTHCFVWSVVPALLAGSAFLFSPMPASFLLVTGFLAHYWQDRLLVRLLVAASLLPSW